MLHLPDPDTGYYDPEERFYELDAEHEAAEEARYLEELEASYDGGVDIDPETGCTAAEMKEDRMPISTEAQPARELRNASTNEGKVA